MAGRMEVGKKDMTKRLKWPFTEKENEEYLFKFERYKSMFTLALQVLQRCLSFFTGSLCSPTLRNVRDQVERISYIVQDSHQMNLGTSFLPSF